jgi:hypothetical protein
LRFFIVRSHKDRSCFNEKSDFDYRCFLVDLGRFLCHNQSRRFANRAENKTDFATYAQDKTTFLAMVMFEYRFIAGQYKACRDGSICDSTRRWNLWLVEQHLAMAIKSGKAPPLRSSDRLFYAGKVVRVGYSRKRSAVGCEYLAWLTPDMYS